MRTKLRTFILHKFMFSAQPEDLSDEASFLDTGIIDSTGVVELLAFIEEEFGIEVADEEVIPENLDSVNHLCSYLEKKGVALSQA